MLGHVSSLNASVAGSILLYEASSQRGVERPLIASIFAPDATPDATPPTGPASRKRRPKAAPSAALEPVIEHSEVADGGDALLPGPPAAQPEPDSAQ
jgi:hypothetical protein